MPLSAAGGKKQQPEGSFGWNRVPAKTKRWPNAGLMLGQRRRRWPIIDPALGQLIVFAGVRLVDLDIGG